MGGQGSGRPPSVETLVKRQQEQRTPIGDSFFLPNLSGDHTAGHTKTPVKDASIANKKYVDDADNLKLDLDGGNANQTIDIGSEDLTTTGDIQSTTANLAGMDISNDGTKTTFLGKTGDYNRIGDGTTTVWNVADEDDMLITGHLDVAESCNIGLSLRLKSPNPSFSFTGLDIGGLYSSSDIDQFLIMSSVTFGRQFVFVDAALYDKDYDHPTQTNPTLFIHSATNPDTDNTQWLSLTHDQTDGVIITGTGDLHLNPAGDVNCKNGATGTFTTVDGKTVTVTKGVITSIV